MTLHLEWIDSHLLFMDRWQLSDDVIVKQRHQMRFQIVVVLNDDNDEYFLIN